MNVRTDGRRGVVAMRVGVWACGVALAVGGCGASGGDSSGGPSSAGSAPPTASPSPSTSALEPRTYLPPLVNGEANACLPLCVAGKETPGDVPLGRYQTKWFFGGYMTLNFERPWSVTEDSTGELKVNPAAEQEYGVSFALDLFPVKHEKRVKDVPNTVAGWLKWLGSNSSLTISKPATTTIGSLPAKTVDIAISKSAVNDDPGCPARVCVYTWGFPQWDLPGGIAGDDVYRLYLADVQFSNTKHLFTVTVEGQDRAHLAAIVPTVEQLLRTVTVPARPG